MFKKIKEKRKQQRNIKECEVLIAHYEESLAFYERHGQKVGDMMDKVNVRMGMNSQFRYKMIIGGHEPTQREELDYEELLEQQENTLKILAKESEEAFEKVKFYRLMRTFLQEELSSLC
jgi:hypothetical protein